MASLKVRLQLQHIGGKTVFTSKDVPGLFVSHHDAEFARKGVEPSIRSLQRARREDTSVALEIIEPITGHRHVAAA